MKLPFIGSRKTVAEILSSFQKVVDELETLHSECLQESKDFQIEVSRLEELAIEREAEAERALFAAKNIKKLMGG